MYCNIQKTIVTTLWNAVITTLRNTIIITELLAFGTETCKTEIDLNYAITCTGWGVV